MAELSANTQPHLNATTLDSEERAKQAPSAPSTSALASDMSAVASNDTKGTLGSPIIGTKLADSKRMAVDGNQNTQDTHENTSLTLDKQVQEICNNADTVLGYMYQIKNHMADFETYIETQKAKNKPLYQWAKYSNYRTLSRTISNLEEAAAMLKLENLPKDEVKLYLRKATQFSLSISKVAVFAMGVMRQKFDTCITDIEESDLSAEGKDSAKVLVTHELEKLIKHCTRATGRVYAALDLLRECLPVEESSQDTQLANIKKLISESEDRIRTSRRDWLWITLALVLSAAVSAAVGLSAAHLYGLISPTKGTATYGQMLDLVQRSHAVANLTGEIHMIKMQDLNERYKELEAIAEGHGLRIDNLVEALGPTNEEGLYYSSTWKAESDVPSSVQHRVRRLSELMDRELKRVHQEVDRMRKTIARMDINFSTRLDKAERVKG